MMIHVWTKCIVRFLHTATQLCRVHFLTRRNRLEPPCSPWSLQAWPRVRLKRREQLGKKRGFRDRNKLNVVLRSSLKLPSTSRHQSITSSSAKKLWNTCCLHDRSFTVENICQSVNFSFLPNILSVACPKSPCNVLSLRIDRGSVSDSGNTPHRGQQETHAAEPGPLIFFMIVAY